MAVLILETWWDLELLDLQLTVMDLCSELTWEVNPIKLSDGTERRVINDNDTVIMKASVRTVKFVLALESLF
jgi:hypothetical protein